MLKKLLLSIIAIAPCYGISVHELSKRSVLEKNLEMVGTHIIAELEGCQLNLNNAEELETALRQAATDAGATVLAVKTHQFEPQGITGVAVLQESHISIHTWPEHGYVAMDIFTCGSHVVIARAFELLRDFFQPTHVHAITLDRGMDKTITDLG